MLPSPRRNRVVVPALIASSSLLLAGCGASSAASDDGASSPPAVSSTAAGTASSASGATPSATSSASGAGCAATSEQVPDGAAVASTADLDHDGAADELWLADVSPPSGDQRLLGVRTASGGVFSTAYTSASPIATTAVGQRLDGSTSIVLLSNGRQVPLYAVVDCTLVPTQNEQGQQYTFDLGFTGYGSGVACVPADGSGSTDAGADLALYGLLVVGGEADGDLPSIQRTRIELSDDGRRARNGDVDSPAELAGVNPEGPQVAAARSVACGDQGPDTAAHEPQS